MMEDQLEEDSIKETDKLRTAHSKKRYQSLFVLTCAALCYNLSSFFFGYCMVYFNAIDYESIHRVFNISLKTSLSNGILSGCISFGALFGSYFSHFILARFSRRESFLLANAIAFLAGLLIMIRNFELLVLGRIIQGICVGFFSTLTPIMIKEYVPVELSGSFGAFLSPIIACGFFIGYLIPYLLSRVFENQLESYWMYGFAFCQFSLILQSFLLWKVFPDETPKYLLSNGKIHQAKQLIAKIYRPEFVEQVLLEKLKDLDKIPSHHQLNGFINPNEQKNSSSSEDEIESQKKNKKYPSDIPVAKLFAFCLQIFQQLSGINVIIIYGHELAAMALPSLKEELPLIINGEKMVVAIVAVLLLNRFGRRAMLIRGVFGVFLSLIGLTFGYIFHDKESKPMQILILCFFTAYIISFVLTMGPITWLYIPEVVQPPTVPYTTMTNWAIASCIISLYPIVGEALGAGVFLIFGVCTLVFFLVCLSVMVETKNKVESEIRNQYNAIKSGVLWELSNRIC